MLRSISGGNGGKILKVATVTFPRGGIHHHHDFKELTSSKAIETAKIPAVIVLPVQQHIGAPAQALVEVGQEVKAGEKIAETGAFVTAPIHASADGKVVAIEPRLYFTGTKLTAIVIETSEEQREPAVVKRDIESLSPEEIRNLVREAGIVGLGGAAFPTHVKLSPPEDKPIDTVIINGAECEPYLTVDHRQMLELPERVIGGAELIVKAVNAKRGYIAVEDNKPDAIRVLIEKLGNHPLIQVITLSSKYPQGAEKQLIKAVSGREVPVGGLPSSVGCIVQNVGTTIAIHRACTEGRPLIDRVVTVSGKAIKEPKNLRVRLGTPVESLVEQCGGFNDSLVKVLLGGPMTGFSITDFSVPIVKGSSGVLALTNEETKVEPIKACVRCAQCVTACPCGLAPIFITQYIEHGFYEEAAQAGIGNCMECGICAFLCPSNRPMVQLIRYGKSKVPKG